jgi:NADPH:quinone reductase-like Zn-dependent oxidoreductase
MIDIQSWSEAVLKLRNARAARFQTAERYLGCSAGSVVAVGSRIERFRPGDAVFGDLSSLGFGGGPCLRSRTSLLPKPARMAFEQVAALPQAGARPRITKGK